MYISDYFLRYVNNILTTLLHTQGQIIIDNFICMKLNYIYRNRCNTNVSSINIYDKLGLDCELHHLMSLPWTTWVLMNYARSTCTEDRAA